jgi:hypothetical protein
MGIFASSMRAAKIMPLRPAAFISLTSRSELDRPYCLLPTPSGWLTRLSKKANFWISPKMSSSKINDLRVQIFGILGFSTVSTTGCRRTGGPWGFAARWSRYRSVVIQPPLLNPGALGARGVGEKPVGMPSRSGGRVARLADRSGYSAEGMLLRCPASHTEAGGRPIETPKAHSHRVQGVRRRAVLQAGLAAGVTLSTWSLPVPRRLWGAEARQPMRGGILRVSGYDPPPL